MAHLAHGTVLPYPGAIVGSVTRRERGQDTMEYAVLAACLVGLVIAVVILLGPQVHDAYANVVNHLAGLAPSGGSGDPVNTTATDRR
ncbi:MAG: hypothetical protein NVS4B2_30200 [Chloroflexota bacterium]